MRCYLLIRLRVREYTNWRADFDANTEWRQDHGEKKFHVYQDIDQLNMVTVICEWENVERAKKFISDEFLSERMQFSGVMEQPIIYFLTKN